MVKSLSFPEIIFISSELLHLYSLKREGVVLAEVSPFVENFVEPEPDSFFL